MERKECTADDDFVVEDPCLIRTVTVDTRPADDYCFGELNRGFTQSLDALLELIDTLALPPAQP